MVGRACTYQMPDGRACRATPLRDQAFCFWHSPAGVNARGCEQDLEQILDREVAGAVLSRLMPLLDKDAVDRGEDRGTRLAPESDARAISIASFDRPPNGDRAQDLVVALRPDHNIVWSGEEVARPEGVGRAIATCEMPIEGRDEWLAAARRLA